MLSELNKVVARCYFEVYNMGDIDAVMEFIGPNYVFHPKEKKTNEFR